mmetsp:Transcript_14928/g.21116  ORF Transcript_14928/g.21116 Transcript_14928/m.21116 type:complete len:596 (-) Transcript_14928:178-1965(-)
MTTVSLHQIHKERVHGETSADNAETLSASNNNNDSSSCLPNTIPSIVIKATAIASLGGILFGYDLGVISSALPQLASEFSMNQRQKQLVVSVLYLGGGAGAAIGGTFCDAIGRKQTILWTDAFFLLGALMLSLSHTIEMLVLGRIIVGFAVAVSGVADVSYLTEIAPIEWRGAIVSVNEACISFGFLLAYLVGYLVDRIQPDHGWRSMFAVGGAIAVIQFVGMLYMPESPVWLKERQKEQQLLANDKHHQQSYENYYGREKIACSEDIEQTQLAAGPPYISYTDPSENSSIEAMGLSSQSLYLESTTNHSPPSLFQSMYELVRGRYHQFMHVISMHYRQVWITLFLSVTQQFCGQTPVLNYAPSIFNAAGSGADGGRGSSLLPTVLVGFVKFSVTVVVIWKIEDLGRRFLLLMGMSTIALGLFLLAIAFYLGGINTDAVDDDDYFNSEASLPSSSFGFTLSLIGVVCVVMGYSASFGPLTWLLTSEMFPAHIRGRALGASTIVTYLCASLVTSTFLSAQSLFGSSIVFLLFAIITVSGLLFAYLAIPDTGEKNVQQIETELDSMWFWKNTMTLPKDNNNSSLERFDKDNTSHQVQ